MKCRQRTDFRVRGNFLIVSAGNIFGQDRILIYSLTWNERTISNAASVLMKLILKQFCFEFKCWVTNILKNQSQANILLYDLRYNYSKIWISYRNQIFLHPFDFQLHSSLIIDTVEVQISLLERETVFLSRIVNSSTVSRSRTLIDPIEYSSSTICV